MIQKRRKIRNEAETTALHSTVTICDAFQISGFSAQLRPIDGKTHRICPSLLGLSALWLHSFVPYAKYFLPEPSRALPGGPHVRSFVHLTPVEHCLVPAVPNPAP